MKIVVAMAYYNRQILLDRTLASMECSAVLGDVKLAVVDDASDSVVRVPPAWWRRCRLTRYERKDKFWSFPAVPFNKALQEALDAGAEVVLLQSPECYHVGDVLTHAAGNARKGLYLTYSCLSLSREAMMSGASLGRERELGAAHPTETCSDGPTGWFNHPVHRPCHLEFCLAIHRDDVIRLNGYDERFADGVAVGDCDLLRRARNAGMELSVVDPTSGPFVVHQWHYSGLSPYDDEPRFKRNTDLLARLEYMEPGNIKAMHMFTDDLR